MNQLELLGREAPAFDAGFSRIERTSLGDDAWVEYQRDFVSGHIRLFEELEANTRWRHDRTKIYDKLVDVPRLFASAADDGPVHPLLERIRSALSERYGELFVRMTLAKYRDGNDSVAWHGDRVARRMPQALVATVSLGGPRRFLLRPYGGGSSMAWSLGSGDLFVMGGSCQRTWQHCVPKVRQAPPRIAIMFRPAWAE